MLIQKLLKIQIIQATELIHRPIMATCIQEIFIIFLN